MRLVYFLIVLVFITVIGLLTIAKWEAEIYARNQAAAGERWEGNAQEYLDKLDKEQK